MIPITDKISIRPNEIQYKSTRSSGAGGQHVNKVETAVQLKFDINKSSLPSAVKEALLKSKDSRITSNGVLQIKSQKWKSQIKNRDDVLQKLLKIIKKACKPRKKRKSTKPTKASKEKRLKSKKMRSDAKKKRKKLNFHD